MTDPTAFLPDSAAAWARFAAGLTVWLLPGLAAADRWMPGPPGWRLLWAPVWSWSLLALWGILLDFAGVPIATWPTGLLALGLAAFVARRRLASSIALLARIVRPVPGAARGPRPPVGAQRGSGATEPAASPWESVGVVVAMGLVGALAFLPHILGPGGDLDALDAPQALARRWWDPDIDPYPLHVDEHYHMAAMAAIERTGRVAPPDPYTGRPQDIAFFSVSGFREEHGYQVGVVQLRLLTDAPLPMLFLAGPAAMSALLAGGLWLTLRPAPGSLAAAALVGVLHSTPRFLGPAFLIPSAMGLPWLLAILTVALKARGPQRLFGLVVLTTCAYLMHTVIGTLGLAMALTGILLGPGSLKGRLAVSAAALLPLLWILPAAGEDIAAAVASTHDLPFDQAYFRTPGWPFFLAAAGGALVAWAWPTRAAAPHRALSILATAAVASLLGSIAAGHANDATYSRLVHAFFLSLAALAGLALGHAGAWLLGPRATPPMERPAGQAGMPAARLGPARRWPWSGRPQQGSLAPGAKAGPPAWRERLRGPVRVALGVAAVAGLMAPAVAAHLEEPYYRIHDASTWQTAQALAAGGVGPGDVLLCDPYQAPVFNAFTGARPWAPFYPGVAPQRAADIEHYLATSGADPAWLQARGITVVAGLPPPNATAVALAPGIYRLAPPGP